MLRASESKPGSPKPKRLWFALVALGLALLVVAWFVAGPGALRPVDGESAGRLVPSEVAPLTVLEHGQATLADIAWIDDDFSRNAALYVLIADATQGRLEEWLADVDTLPATRHRADLARVLYIRFAVLDPEAALQHALRGSTKASWLAAIFRTWGQVDPDAAAVRAGSLHPSAKAVASRALLELDLPRPELRAMVARLDESRPNRDARRQVQLLTGKPPLTPSNFLLAQIEARAHAKREGESHADAWNRAIGLEEALVRQVLVNQIALEWALKDPVAALAAVEAWDTDDVYQVSVTGGGYAPNFPIRRILPSRIVSEWAQNDSQAALSWAMGLDAADMQMYVPVVLTTLAEHAPGEAIARLADLPGPLRARAAGGVLWTLARTDLEHAMRLFESLGIEEQSPQNTMAVRQNLISQRSPQRALDWALSLDRRIRTREVSSVLGVVSVGDLPEAMRLFDSIEDPAIRAAAAPSLVGQQVQRDAQEALAWARNFTPEAERGKLVVQVFTTWSRMDAGGASRALLASRGGSTRDRAAAAMMASVVGHDTSLAERLFDSIKTPEQQTVAAQTLYRHFTDIEVRQRKAERYRKYLPPEDDDPADDEEAS